LLKAKYIWKLQVEGIVPDTEIFRNILTNRGIDDPDRFFSLGEESVYDPYLLKDMKKAATRIWKALSASEKILIYGDYDCDGISSISVLVRALRKLGADVDYDLPDRFQDGYGLNMKAVAKIIDAKYDLVITVDNGITCNDEIAMLAKAGIDTIITDHHEPKEEIPAAFAILHPKLSPDYPFQEVAGVMVAYKLARAITNEKLEDLYDLVMIGTIADLVPLVDENQAIVNLGLKQLEHTKIPGLRKLVEFSHPDKINETAIAFKIAPKINSSGRLGKAMQAVRLLVSESEREVNDLIYTIEANHASRKDLTETAVKLCESLVDPRDDVLVVMSEKIHEGVLGICAQKLVEKFQKSAIVFTIDESGKAKGSARAFGDDNILKMLQVNEDVILKYGGHQQAAGLQINPADLETLRQRLNQISTHQETPPLKVDMAINLSEVSLETVRKLQDFSFFTATFLFTGLYVRKKQLIRDQHTKLQVESDGKLFDLLAFNNPDYFYSLETGDRINVVGGIGINTWLQKTVIQITAKDIECKDFQTLDFRHVSFWRDQLAKVLQKDAILISDRTIAGGLKIQKDGTVIILPRAFSQPLKTVLNKDYLGRCYRIMIREQSETLDHFARFFGLDTEETAIILDIFRDLGFVEIEGNHYIPVDTPPKKDLYQSAKYNHWRVKADLIEKTYAASQRDSKNIIITHLEAYNEI